MSSPALQDIISAVLPVLRMERGISAWRRQSAEAIALCRTGAFGTFRVECPDGHEGFTLNKACWNRNCRGCSAIKTERWVNQRDAQKLDCPHRSRAGGSPRGSPSAG